MLESLPSGWKISSKTFPFSASQSTCSFLWDEVPQSYVWDKKTWVSAQTSDCCLKNLNRIWSNIGRGEKKLKCLKTDVNLNSDDKLNHPLGAKCKNQNASIDIINIYIYTCIYIYTSTPVYYIYIHVYNTLVFHPPCSNKGHQCNRRFSPNMCYWTRSAAAWVSRETFPGAASSDMAIDTMDSEKWPGIFGSKYQTSILVVKSIEVN